ncbi:MAG: hypothetical protein K1W14_02960 [Muribaculaceae bacterium]
MKYLLLLPPRWFVTFYSLDKRLTLLANSRYGDKYQYTLSTSTASSPTATTAPSPYDSLIYYLTVILIIAQSRKLY